jgi:prepilin-type processing-associated H-X9-DG protein
MMNDFQRLVQDQAIFDRSTIPEEVVLAADRRHLRLGWSGGEIMVLAADKLRIACRCAWCTRARIEGTFDANFNHAAISSIASIGDYALNIGFTDGHARGIFPWPYLRAIGFLCMGDGSSE